MYWIGLDPGATGGWGVIRDDSSIADFGLYSNWKSAGSMLETFKTSGCLVALELVHAFPGQGVSAMFSFGKNAGGWEALLEYLEVPHVTVTPQKWQKHLLGTFPKGESKTRAFEYVKRRFPDLNLKKKDHGIVDAICLALYLKDNH